MILEWLLASAMASASVSGAPADPPSRVTRPVQVASAKTIEELWSQLGSALDAGDNATALAVTKLIAGHPDLVREPVERREVVASLLGLLYAGEGQYALALPHLIEASERRDAPADLWFARIGAHAATDDLTAAARATVRLLERQPETAEDLSGSFVLQLESSPDLEPEAAYALRTALHEAGWRDRNDSGVWIRLIDDLLERDRLADATPLVEQVTSSGGLLQFHAMRRYDAVRAAAAVPELDIAAVLQAELEDQRI